MILFFSTALPGPFLPRFFRDVSSITAAGLLPAAAIDIHPESSLCSCQGWREGWTVIPPSSIPNFSRV